MLDYGPRSGVSLNARERGSMESEADGISRGLEHAENPAVCMEREQRAAKWGVRSGRAWDRHRVGEPITPGEPGWNTVLRRATIGVRPQRR